ncbi:AAA family ATPase [Bradyrhizobium diazoefficiens]|nr:AAA family ATPase [Bradyrhizobium diazoefficiens]MBR0851687.1 AAA family ATPase [Bradyrhizobium diazoefficiens]
MSTSEDSDDLGLPAEANDAVSTGAAADSVDTNESLKDLPRLLRYAMLITDSADHIEQRLIAEIDELCPLLPQNMAWAIASGVDPGLALAAELDHRAVVQNEPNLRSLADCVRLVCLPTPSDRTYFADHRRVGKALIQAFQAASRHVEDELCCDLEHFVFGWAALPSCTDLLSKTASAARNAGFLGNRMAEHRVAAAARTAWRKAKEQEERRRQEEAEEKAAEGKEQAASVVAEAVPERQLVVARLSNEAMKNTKLKDILGPLKSVINTPLPLVEVPPLYEVRSTLLSEFPYALEVIDFALADLVGRVTVRLRPLLLVGDVGGGKSRFARRLGEVLGLTVWRTDASRSDGAVFGGTDRRWYSAEPCHPFLAIAQGKTASPLILLDEIEKAGTRSDYGRLWDCLLGFLEPETHARYPDPALQTNLDLSQVSYIATANSLDPLPSPIRDRFRVVSFPKPTAGDVDALLPAVIADLARERGLNASWVPPLDGAEHAAVTRNWRGGSVRRLRRIVEAILRERDANATRN